MPKKNPLNSGNPKSLASEVGDTAILSESDGNTGSVQRLTAQAERRRLGTCKCKHGGVNLMKTNVSTEIKKCECGEMYQPTSNRQFRCVKCKGKKVKAELSKYHKRTYVRKGYSQKGENNNNWSGGIGTYRASINKESCERCGGDRFLLIHHKDENRYNNDTTNLECLCKSCHQRHHRKPMSEDHKNKMHAGRKRYMQEHGKDLFDENGKFKKVCKV